MRRFIFHSESPEKTAQIACALASNLRGGEFVSLEGELGAGKTFFAAALARALGSQQQVQSPTFVLQRIYATPGPRVVLILHYDLYRIADYSELLDLGFSELADDAISVVEWGDRFAELFPHSPIRIRLDHVSEEQRTVDISFPSEEYAAPFAAELHAASIAFDPG